MQHLHRLCGAGAILLLFLAPSLAAGNSGLVYTTAGKHRLRLDVYYPATPPPPAGYPLLISIHGGGWIFGDRHKDLFLRELTNDGYALASIDYRLSNAAKFPAQIDDTRAALRWLIANARSLHLDAARIGVTGASAGAHLALLLGLDPTEKPNPIRAICALYPPTDLVAIIPPDKRNRGDNLVAQLLGAPVSERLELAKAGSPISYAGPHAPPVLLIHGDQDKLVPIDQSRSLNQALRQAGSESNLIIYQGQGHGFGLRGDTLREVAGFFDRHLKN